MATARARLHGRLTSSRRRHRRVLAAVFVGFAAAGLPSPVVASSGGGRQITDAENTRTVYLVVGALVLLAVGLAVYTWWFWRSTRRDHEALAPLEVMADRKFVAADAIARQTMLDGNRPVGAAPLAPGANEPLLVLSTGDGAEQAPATLVVAVVGAGSDTALTNGDMGSGAASTNPPATNGDATVAVPLAEDGAEHADQPADEETAASAGEVEAVEEVDTMAPADVEAVAASDPVPADDSEVRMVVDVMAPTTVATAPLEPAAAAPSTADGASPSAQSNGSAATPTMIDPGLPVPPAEDEPVRNLSLAELVALHPRAPVGFDDGELASTPSTGIPIIESAEAWVERQLAASQAGEGNGTDNGTDVRTDVADDADSADDGAAAAGDDPDEQTPATVGGAE